MDRPEGHAVYEFGDFRVDATLRLLQLKADGRALPLTSRAFDALLYFIQHRGELLDKSALLAAIWPDIIVEENNLNQQVSLLRRVLGETPGEHRFIVTIPGRGYRFVADVTEPSNVSFAGVQPEGGRLDKPPRILVAPVGALGAVAAPEPRNPSLPRRRIIVSAFAIAMAVVVVAIVLGWLRFADHSQRSELASTKVTAQADSKIQTPGKLRLAILPLENLSPDPANAFFTDGLHEEILSTIAERLPSVEVISRTTMTSYRSGPPKPIAVVAHELGASHLIEGSVRREANRVRVTLQLIDAHGDRHIWSQNYDRTLEDALSLESQVAEEVAKQLSVQLLRPRRASEPPTGDPEAFDLYLKARLQLRTFDWESNEQFHTIENLLGQAIAHDPSFAVAYAERARARTLLFISSKDTSEPFVRDIRADLDAARHLAPEDPIVLAATGYFLMCENDTTGALAAYERAETAGLAEPEWFIPKAHLLLRTGRIDELIATHHYMLAVDPANPLIIQFTAFHMFLARQPLEVLRAAHYARDKNPSEADYWTAFVLLTFAGKTDSFHAFMQRREPEDGLAKIEVAPVFIDDYFLLLRFEHRYAQLQALLERVPFVSLRYNAGVAFGPVGETPTDEYRGWVDLLRGDRTNAARAGHSILEFVIRQAHTPWNQSYLELLAATGYTFTGQCAQALAAGQRSLALVSRSENAVIWTHTAQQVARVQAWCGAHREAVDLLEQLAAGASGLAPALISRDPLYVLPLQKEPRFQALAERLENAMRELNLQSRTNTEKEH